MKLGDYVKWQAVKRIRAGVVVGIEKKLLTVRDTSGILWFVQKDDLL